MGKLTEPKLLGILGDDNSGADVVAVENEGDRVEIGPGTVGEAIVDVGWEGVGRLTELGTLKRLLEVGEAMLWKERDEKDRDAG